MSGIAFRGINSRKPHSMETVQKLASSSRIPSDISVGSSRSNICLMGQIKIAKVGSDYTLKSPGAQTCVIMTIYNAEKKVGVMGHFDTDVYKKHTGGEMISAIKPAIMQIKAELAKHGIN